MSRVLIALQGSRMKRAALNAAVNFCEEMKMGVDVLWVDGDEALPPALEEFLERIRQARLGCRLFRQSGPLNLAVVDHTNQHKSIYVILVDSMKHWGHGVPFRSLSQPVGVLSSIAA